VRQDGLSYSHWIDNYNLQNTYAFNISVPGNAQITGAHINVSQEIQIIMDGLQNQPTFMLNDKEIDIALTYSINTGICDSDIPVNLLCQELTIGAPITMDDNSTLLETFSTNGRIFGLYIILSDSDMITIKLNKLGL